MDRQGLMASNRRPGMDSQGSVARDRQPGVGGQGLAVRDRRATTCIHIFIHYVCPLVTTTSPTGNCCDTVMVSGAESSQSALMGQYTILRGIERANRPVYKNSNGEYIYYYAAHKTWNMGADYDASAAGVSTYEDSNCPVNVAKWDVSDVDGWSSSYTVTVRCTHAHMHARTLVQTYLMLPGLPCPRIDGPRIDGPGTRVSEGQRLRARDRRARGRRARDRRASD